jgi:hypothetical protein
MKITAFYFRFEPASQFLFPALVSACGAQTFMPTDAFHALHLFSFQLFRSGDDFLPFLPHCLACAFHDD